MPTPKRPKLRQGAFALAAPTEIQSRQFALDEAADAVVEYVYALPVLPPSPAVPQDGRDPVLFDVEAFIAAFNARKRKVPLDVGHLTEYAADAEAVGWVEELYGDETGAVWAWVRLNSEGVELIDGKRFGYTSPTLRGYKTDEGWLAVSLKSLALTNNPALEMASTFAAEGEDDTEDDEQGAPTTGDAAPAASEPQAPAAQVEVPQAPAQETPAASPEATDAPASTEQAPSASAEATPVANATQADTSEPSASADAAAFAAVRADAAAAASQVLALTAEKGALAEQVATYAAQVLALTARAEAAETQVQALSAKVAQMEASAREAAVVAAVDAAISEGREGLTPAVRDHLLAFARADLAGFQAYAARLPKSAAFGAVATSVIGDENFGLSPEQLAECRRLGIKPETYARTLNLLSN